MLNNDTQSEYPFDEVMDDLIRMCRGSTRYALAYVLGYFETSAPDQHARMLQRLRDQRDEHSTDESK